LFEKVIDNISDYTSACPVVGVGYVVSNQNCSNLETLVKRLKILGVSYIQFRPVIDHPELLPEINLNYLTRYISGQNFNIIIDGMEENKESGNKGLPCRAHSLTTVISADGNVYLCGRLNKYNWFEPMGNINEHSFHSIWNGENRKKQAKQVLDPEFCKQFCPECRITKFNCFIANSEKIHTRSFI